VSSGRNNTAHSTFANRSVKFISHPLESVPSSVSHCDG
jgi:hypothetical protein